MKALRLSHELDLLVPALGAAGITPVGAPLIVMHDVIDEQTDGDLEICVPVPPGTTMPTASAEPRGLAVRDLEGGTVATVTHHGPYDQIAPAYHTLTGWIAERGHEIVGPPREVYLNDPQTVAPEELATLVEFPIKPTPAPAPEAR